MQLNLAGKTALVTGSSRGIGFAIARALHAEGVTVALNGRTTSDVDSSAMVLPGSIPIVGDVSQTAEAGRILGAAVDALGGIDILVCNVGTGRSVPPGDETYDEWQRIFSLNLWSTTNMIEAARPALAKSKGVIVCVSSICGAEVIADAPITYSAAKAALNAYVRGIARPLGKSGVRINAVAPGNIIFEGSVWSTKLRENSEAVARMLASNVALGKLGTPEDVASLVVYLASPISNFSSGAIWSLDGGQSHS